VKISVLAWMLKGKTHTNRQHDAVLSILSCFSAYGCCIRHTCLVCEFLQTHCFRKWICFW